MSLYTAITATLLNKKTTLINTHYLVAENNAEAASIALDALKLHGEAFISNDDEIVKVLELPVLISSGRATEVITNAAHKNWKDVGLRSSSGFPASWVQVK